MTPSRRQRAIRRRNRASALMRMIFFPVALIFHL